MPLRKPDLKERLSKKSNGQGRMYRLQKLICMAGTWGNQKKVVLLRWHQNRWQLWKGNDPITTSSVEEQ